LIDAEKNLWEIQEDAIMCLKRQIGFARGAKDQTRVWATAERPLK